MSSPGVAPTARNTGLSDDKRSANRIGMLVANAWLLFLLFPLLTVLPSDQSSGRKLLAVAILGLFAAAHVIGYRTLIRRELGLDEPPSEAATEPMIGPVSRPSAIWFAVMVVLTGLGLVVGGWAMFGMVPFLVSYAFFHFPWRPAAVVFVLSLATVVVAPALAGVLDEIWFFAIIVGSVGAAAVLIRLSEDRQQERNTFNTRLALSDERNRVARDVHDVLGHSLTAVILKGQVIDRMLDRLDPSDDANRQIVEQAREQLAELDTVSRRALAEIRSTVGGLRSADLADELTAARAVLADAGVTLTVSGDAGGVDDRMRLVLGWVVREAVTNVVRHARADHCAIEIGCATRNFLLRVTDDGVGVASSDEGNGLTGLRERVRAAGADLRVGQAEVGAGTMVEVIA